MCLLHQRCLDGVISIYKYLKNAQSQIRRTRLKREKALVFASVFCYQGWNMSSSMGGAAGSGDEGSNKGKRPAYKRLTSAQTAKLEK